MIKWNECKRKIEPLKSGQKATYEILGVGVDPLSTDGRPELPFMFGIPKKDRIVDEDNNIVDIGYITGYEQGNSPKFGSIVFTKAQGGTITLHGGRAEDMSMYFYMERTNYNESNPHRDPSVSALFKRQNWKKDQADKRQKRGQLVDAISTASKLTAVEMRRIAIALNISADDQEEIKARIEDFAELNPTKFLSMLENADLAIIEVADAAEKAKLISVDQQSRKILSSNGSTLYAWGPEANVDWKEKFVQFTKSEDGQAFYKEIQMSLKAKK